MGDAAVAAVAHVFTQTLSPQPVYHWQLHISGSGNMQQLRTDALHASDALHLSIQLIRCVSMHWRSTVPRAL